MRRNCEWLDMNLADLLKLMGSTTVARLLERDDFQKRMAANAPIAAHELLYPLLQGYDSVAIDADVELGGTDQKFNLLFGRDVQSAYGKPQQSILTMPILVGTDGVQKMSKSLGNYIGVTDPPAEMFGKLMSIPDEAMDEYFRLLLGAEGRAGGAAEPGQAGARPADRRPLPRRRERGGGRGGLRQGLRPARRSRRHPRGRSGRLRRGRHGEVHLPRLIAGAFGVSSSEARRLICSGRCETRGAAASCEATRRPRRGPWSAGSCKSASDVSQNFPSSD